MGVEGVIVLSKKHVCFCVRKGGSVVYIITFLISPKDASVGPLCSIFQGIPYLGICDGVLVIWVEWCHKEHHLCRERPTRKLRCSIENLDGANTETSTTNTEDPIRRANDSIRYYPIRSVIKSRR